MTISIYRLGRLIGQEDLKTWNPEDFITQLLKCVDALGSAPDLKMFLEMRPVQDVARELTHFILNPSTYNQTYHLHQASSLQWSDFVNRLRPEVPKLTLLPYAQWLKKLSSYTQEHELPEATLFYQSQIFCLILRAKLAR